MRKAFVVIMVSAIIACTSFVARSEDISEFIYGAHFSSQSGVSSSKVFAYTNRILELLTESRPVEITLKKLSSEDEITSGFLNGDIDMGMLFSYQIVNLLREGGDIYPLVTYAHKKSRHMQYCIFNEKDKPITEIGDLEGKRLIRQMYNPFAYLQIRDFLYNNGIDKPLWEVFSSFTSVPNNNSAMMAIAAGKADVYWTSEEIILALKYSDQRNVAEKIDTSICTDSVYGHVQIAVNKKTVDQEKFDKLYNAFKEVMSNIDEYAAKDNNLIAGLRYMKLEEVEIAPADRSLFKYELELRDKADKNGWWEEAVYISEKLQEAGLGKEVVVKPDLPYCKKKCAEGDNECIVACISGN